MKNIYIPVTLHWSLFQNLVRGCIYKVAATVKYSNSSAKGKIKRNLLLCVYLVAFKTCGRKVLS